MQQRDAGKLRVSLRKEEFAAACENRGWRTDTDRARHLDMGRTTVMRVVSGQTDPGTRFIAAVLRAFPQSRFEDFFEVNRDFCNPQTCMHARKKEAS